MRRHLAAAAALAVLPAFTACGTGDEGTTVAAVAAPPTTTTTAVVPPPTTTTPPETTTSAPPPTTEPARSTTTVRVSRSQPEPAPAPASSAPGRVSSTAYCLTGNMANGSPARRGAVAMGTRRNPWPPLGTQVTVSDSPWGPGTFTVEDRIGHSSQLDFAMPGDCAGARQWGRRAVTVTVG